MNSLGAPQSYAIGGQCVKLGCEFLIEFIELEQRDYQNKVYQKLNTAVSPNSSRLLTSVPALWVSTLIVVGVHEGEVNRQHKQDVALLRRI